MIYLLLALLAGVATLFGGILHSFTRLKKINMRYSVGFSAGILISTAIFDMIPEMRPTSFDTLALALGFFLFYLVEKVMMIHACGEQECKSHEVTQLGIAALSMDNIVDGAAIAAGFFINPMLGITIALAVAVHEIPQGFSTSVIMQRGKYKKKWVMLMLIIAALMTPIGAYLSLHITEQFFGHILAFSAGTFLYVGASDMLPEAHKKFNIKVILAVMLGAVFIPVAGMILGA